MRNVHTFVALVIAALCCTTNALTDAGNKTPVTVEASAYDTRASECPPDGCVASNTRDNSLDDESRWSCKKELEDEQCVITYSFEEPQDIVRLRIAFHQGTERTRTLKVITNGNKLKEITSSGDTDGYQNFLLNTDETETLALESIGLSTTEWISLKEVKIMVEN